VMIGYDAGKQLKDEIKSGVVLGAISQDPVQIGYKCVDSAMKAIKGTALPKMIDTGFKWYDKSNINDPAMQPLLYD
jgi:ribose transport system substrate-binding protein